MRFPRFASRRVRAGQQTTRNGSQLNIEELEDRVQPANLSVTSAYLSDGEGNKA